MALKYEPGACQQYTYDTAMHLTDPESVAGRRRSEHPALSSPFGYRLKATASVCCLWSNGESDQLLSFQLTDCQVSGVGNKVKTKNIFRNGTPPAARISKTPLLLHSSSGRILEVFTPKLDDENSVNMKMGFANIFQLPANTNQPSKQDEVDLSGECMTTYKMDDNKVTKTKTNCKMPAERQHPKQILGAKLVSSSICTYEISEDNSHIVKAVAGESYQLSVAVQSDLSVSVQARQTLNWQKTSHCETVVAKSVLEAVHAYSSSNLKVEFRAVPFSLTSKQETTGASEEQVDVKTKPGGAEPHVTSLRAEVAAERRKQGLNSEFLSTNVSAKTFLKLLPTMAAASKGTVTAILRDENNTEVLPQLIDVIAAAQTADAYIAFFDFLKTAQDVDTTSLAERFLLGASYSTNPPAELFHYLLELLKKNGVNNPKNTKLQESVVTTLGALLQACRSPTVTCENNVFSQSKSALLEALSACSHDSCRAMYLRGLGNAMLPEFIDVYLNHLATCNSTSVCEAAISSLERLDIKQFDENATELLMSVYGQYKRAYDQTIRSTAATLLLQAHPTRANVETIIKSLSDREIPELTAFVWAKAKDTIMRDEYLKNTIKSIMHSPDVANYHVLGQKGFSGAITNLMADTKDVVSTYGMLMEFGFGGALKRSSMDVFLAQGDTKLQMLSVKLSAGGLESFVADAEELSAEAAEEEATASMALRILDVALRPVVLFEGQGDLMSIVWSGTGSEPISACQANLLMQDHRQVIPLQCGIVVDLNIRGVISIDLSGMIEISLWNRNCQSVIMNAASVVIEGSASVRTSFIHASVQYMGLSQANIDFTTDVEFYESPFKMCMIMTQPPFSFHRTVKMVEKVPGKKRGYTITSTSKTQVNGKSYFLHPQISELCKLMHDAQQ